MCEGLPGSASSYRTRRSLAHPSLLPLTPLRSSHLLFSPFSRTSPPPTLTSFPAQAPPRWGRFGCAADGSLQLTDATALDIACGRALPLLLQ